VVLGDGNYAAPPAANYFVACCGRTFASPELNLPELELEPLAQKYTRLAENRYRYECANQRLVADFEVNDIGLVGHLL